MPPGGRAKQRPQCGRRNTICRPSGNVGMQGFETNKQTTYMPNVRDVFIQIYDGNKHVASDL